MDWLERTKRAMDYIEDNLTNDIEYTKIAQKACCSTYHFSRMFAAITGIQLSEYIRRRRLSLAAFELQNSDIKVIDLAVKYGYESADSFSRAFKKLHKVRPTDAKKSGTELKVFPRISFQIKIKGDVEMDYRIEDLDFEFNVVGLKNRVETKKAFKEIPTLWRDANKTGIMKKLIDMAWEAPKCKLECLLGICGKTSSIKSETFDYLIGVRYDKDVPDGMEKIVVPKSTWAVFPNTVDAWKRLYSEWLPTSGYDLADIPCIECYYPPNHETKDEELWVPIIKK